VACHGDVDSTRVNSIRAARRRGGCDLYVGKKNLDFGQADLARTVICQIPDLDWPHHSISGDNFIYSKDIAIIEALEDTTTLPPEHLRDGTGGEENDDDTWPRIMEDSKDPEEDPPEGSQLDGHSPTMW